MKLFKNKLTVTIVVLSVTFLGLIIYTASKDTKGLEGNAGELLNPMQRIIYNINNGAKNFVDFFLNFSEVKNTNAELVKENNELKNELATYSNLKEENERLKSLLEFKDQNDEYTYLATNIIGYTPGGILDGYIVDKGEKDGVEKGMVVIAAEGLVGQVTTVGKNWSIIQCIINENVAVSVMSENSGENTGVLQGYVDSKNRNLTKVNYLPIDSDIKEGDVILTSGLGLVYPKNIRVGKVISVEEDKVKVMKSAIVEPYVDFNKLGELLIIVPKDKKEINISVKRDDEEKNFKVAIKTIEKPVVTRKVFTKNGKKVGYIYLSSFTENSANQVKTALKELDNEKIDSLIFDVRSNTGGYLTSVTDILNMFLKKGHVLYSLEEKDKKQTYYDTTKEEYDKDVVVLIDRKTASASEILASSLKESYGAIVVGTTSYGKGKVQNTYRLTKDTMLKYTTAKWYTPLGNSIDEVGITPGVYVTLDKKYAKNPCDDTDNQLQKAIEILTQ